MPSGARPGISWATGQASDVVQSAVLEARVGSWDSMSNSQRAYRAHENIQWVVSTACAAKCNLYRLIQLIRVRANHVIIFARIPQARIATDLKICTDEFNLLHFPPAFSIFFATRPISDLKNPFQSLSDPSLPTGGRTTSSSAGPERQRRSHLGGALLVNFPSPSWSVSPLAFTHWCLDMYCDESNM